MKYRVISWVHENGNEFLLSKDKGVIELEPIIEPFTADDLGLNPDHFNINSFMKPLPKLDHLDRMAEHKPKPTYKVGDKVRVVGDGSNSVRHNFKIGEIVEVVSGKLFNDSLWLKNGRIGQHVNYSDVEPYTENQVKPDSPDTDDSWKVTEEEWMSSPWNTFNFTNSKLEPWVMRCGELEQSNRNLLKCSRVYDDKVKELEARNKSLVHNSDVANKIMLDTAEKYDALKEVADRMAEFINYRRTSYSDALSILKEYEKLTK